MNIAERAEQAAVYIEQGWARNVLESGTGRVCAVGALNKSFTGNAGSSPAALNFSWSSRKFREWKEQCNDYDLLVKLTIQELTRWRRWRGISDFTAGHLISINDSSRSGKHIARALRRVAKKLAAEPAESKVTQRDMELAGGPSL